MTYRPLSDRPLSEVLQVLESDQEIELPMSPDYYTNLHDKIMRAVDRVDGASPAWLEEPMVRAKMPSWRGLSEATKPPLHIDPKLNS